MYVKVFPWDIEDLLIRSYDGTREIQIETFLIHLMFIF